MKFYDREEELNILFKAEKLSLEESQMTFIIGRRRVGKTRLIKEAFKNRNLVYFFVSRKDEKLKCGWISGETGKRIRYNKKG